jgi:hypothetical protein
MGAGDGIVVPRYRSGTVVTVVSQPAVGAIAVVFFVSHANVLYTKHP